MLQFPSRDDMVAELAATQQEDPAAYAAISDNNIRALYLIHCGGDPRLTGDLDPGDMVLVLPAGIYQDAVGLVVEVNTPDPTYPVADQNLIAVSFDNNRSPVGFRRHEVLYVRRTDQSVAALAAYRFWEAEVAAKAVARLAKQAAARALSDAAMLDAYRPGAWQAAAANYRAQFDPPGRAAESAEEQGLFDHAQDVAEADREDEAVSAAMARETEAADAFSADAEQYAQQLRER